MRRDKPGRPWHLYPLGAVVIVVAVLAATEIGPPASSARTAREVVTAEDGVVQSTVTGTGNVEAGTDVNVNFQTSGTLSQVFVSEGQHVNEGQLLATLDSTSAQLAVNQAQESLTAAQDQLTELQNGTATSGSGSGGGSGSGAGGASGSGAGGGSGSGSSGGSGSGSSGARNASLDSSDSPSTEFVSLVKAPRKPSKPKQRKPAPTRIVTVTVPAAPTRTATTPTRTTTRTATTATTTTTTPSPSSMASAQAAVYSAEANLHTAQQALTKTSLYAPVSGTVVSLASLSPGDPVSAGNTGTASSLGGGSVGGAGGGGASGAGGGGASGAGGGAGTSAGSLGGGSSGSSSSSGGGGASTPFATIVDTGSLTMTVAFSESDISKVAVGQSATVTMDALSGLELAAHVSSISSVGTISNGVVSYDATLTLDQTDPRVKPGMSASASVITGQASGVTVPSQAVLGTGSLGTVDVLQNGKSVAKQVIVGLRGTTRTEIVSGLAPGEQLVVTITLPALGTQSSSTTPSGGTLGGGRFGGGGLGGGGFGGARALFGGGGGLGGGLGGGGLGGGLNLGGGRGGG
jgi:multidrug efflux pump subunit AcrA (membrane-fusion protein)